MKIICASMDKSFSYFSEYFPIASEPLTSSSGMGRVVRAMQQKDSGLDVRDRNWLKMQIPNAFLGMEVVDWLFANVQGFSDRKEARKFAVNMLKAGFIKSAVDKTSFSEQCYFSFGDESVIASGASLSKGNF